MICGLQGTFSIGRTIAYWPSEFRPAQLNYGSPSNAHQEAPFTNMI